jgi:hypothetical protein
MVPASIIALAIILIVPGLRPESRPHRWCGGTRWARYRVASHSPWWEGTWYATGPRQRALKVSVTVVPVPMRCRQDQPNYAISAKHQISIWCYQLLGLPCSVNDAVNVLPCATCAYLDGQPS